MPRFAQELLSPKTQRLLIAGCGGGFDFVHGLLLMPMLLRAHKEVIIGSYAFGRPQDIAGARSVDLTAGVRGRPKVGFDSDDLSYN